MMRRVRQFFGVIPHESPKGTSVGIALPARDAGISAGDPIPTLAPSALLRDDTAGRPPSRHVPRGVVALTLLVAVAAALSAQAAYRGYVQGGDLNDIHNAPYDGRFTFFRVRFEPPGGMERGWRVDRKWDHDVPRAEIHFMKIMRELSTLRPYMEGGNIFALDDPEIFRYPVAYLSEPGFWAPTEKEAAALRAYLLKGGFLILDDFVGPHWANFEERMRQVLPQGRLVELDASHPVFDSFFHIPSLDGFNHPYFGAQSKFYGIFEDNDPKKRLMVIANYNNDLGDYMEWSDEGFLPIQLTNEAYKLAVNYVMYAMTH